MLKDNFQDQVFQNVKDSLIEMKMVTILVIVVLVSGRIINVDTLDHKIKFPFVLIRIEVKLEKQKIKIVHL